MPPFPPGKLLGHYVALAVILIIAVFIVKQLFRGIDNQITDAGIIVLVILIDLSVRDRLNPAAAVKIIVNGVQLFFGDIAFLENIYVDAVGRKRRVELRTPSVIIDFFPVYRRFMTV